MENDRDLEDSLPQFIDRSPDDNLSDVDQQANWMGDETLIAGDDYVYGYDDRSVSGVGDSELVGLSRMHTTVPSDHISWPAIHRVSSSEVVFSEKRPRYKVFGQRFVMGDLLGEGSFGKVKECIDTVTLKRHAVKIIKNKKTRKIRNGEQCVKSEIRLLKYLNHKNVISLVDYCCDTTKQKQYIILEYCAGSLQDVLEKLPGKKLAIFQAHDFFRQLTDGLEYLHGSGVVHKDIKPGNLLVTIDGVLKITDFGVAEKLEFFSVDDTCTMSQGTPTFQPPEIAKGFDSFSGFKVDIWSSGVTLFNLTTGKYPFDGQNVYQLYENIATGIFSIPDDLDTSLRSLIIGMLKSDPNERFSLEQVRKHEWVVQNTFAKEPKSNNGKELPFIATIPPLQSHNKTYALSVLPYIEEHFYGSQTTSGGEDQQSVRQFPAFRNFDSRSTGSVAANSAQFQNQQQSRQSREPQSLQQQRSSSSSAQSNRRNSSFISIKRHVPSACKIS